MMNKKDEQQTTVLNIPFTTKNKREVLAYLKEQLSKTQQLFLATPNPEMLLEAYKNQNFKKILQQTNLNLPDGIGIIWAADFLNWSDQNKSRLVIIIKALVSLLKILFAPKSLYKIFQERITGVDIMKEVCSNQYFQSYKIFFLGAETGIAKIAAQKLKSSNPLLHIAGTYSGSPTDSKNLELINSSKADILFVAFGSPKQEIWIKENLQKLPSVKLTIGVGGAFDFIAGKRKRAPALLQKLGLEWLFRVIQEPTRIKRIFNATVKFPIVIIKWQLTKPDK